MSFRDNVRELHALNVRKAAQKRSRGFWSETRELNRLVKLKMKEGRGRDALRRAVEAQIGRADAMEAKPPPVGGAKSKRMFALGFLLGFGWRAVRRK